VEPIILRKHRKRGSRGCHPSSGAWKYFDKPFYATLDDCDRRTDRRTDTDRHFL